MADVVVANDPITGQGSNNASHCAAIYQQAILDHGQRPFDREFMKYAFEAYWDDVRWVTRWTDTLLLPPPPHMLELLGAAQAHEEIRHRFANGFNNPRDFFDWFMDPGRAAAFLAGVTSRAGTDDQPVRRARASRASAAGQGLELRPGLSSRSAGGRPARVRRSHRRVSTAVRSADYAECPGC